MTHKVIYHDFRQTNHPSPEAKPATILTARVLVRGRRWHQFWNNMGKTIDSACLALCGSCIAVSMVIVLHILLS